MAVATPTVWKSAHGVGKHAAELAEEARIWTSAVATVTRESLARSAPSAAE